ncbi:HalOD1 output domain-containing protein [Halorussus sp. GCM10023401]|uniref:HalOD1 output domain-containing protein n=1 Tax=Halorussus sp. GCM10023401 TaxID=3252680 RepID=UPI003613615A
MESETYQQDSETYRFEFDQDTTSASMAVVAALSEVIDRDLVELDPLHDIVDTDALDELVRVREPMDGDISVRFTVAEYAITVYSDGTVALAPSGHDRTETASEGAFHK